MARRTSKWTPLTADGSVLVVNCGSSSVKFALFAAENDTPRRLWSGALDRIGLPEGRIRANHEDSGEVLDQTLDVPNHVAALDLLFSKLERLVPRGRIQAVGHRVVHGGNECDCPHLVTPALEARLRRLTPLAPLHLPHNLAGIMSVRVRRPDLPQVACFDTAFHHALPHVARLTGLPRSFEDQGVRRFGFHGLSYEYVIEELRRRHGDESANGRIVVAHLGNGASMTAVRNGRSVDTTMGFSTLGGLPMGTRSGDLDPGLLLYLIMQEGMTAEEVQDLFYEQSGLLGLSGISRNMQELLARSGSEPAAAEAVDFFCYQARKHLVALTSTLGGLDRLVFTGGIGANAPEVRTKICEDLAYLGIVLDETRNAAGERTISRDHSEVAVEAFATDEELMIARHVRDVLATRPIAAEA